MSQVLVSSPATSPLSVPMMPVVEAPEPPSQLHLNVINLAGDWEVNASVEEKRMASQLAYLASQHHTSEYNRLKFGPGGAPVMYIPLSIQLPAQVRELKAKQVHNLHKRTWWPAQPLVEASVRERMELDPVQNCTQDCDLEPPQQENVMPYAQISSAPESDIDDLPVNLSKPVPPLNHSPTLNLRRELSVAMSSPLSIITIPQLSPRDMCQQPNLNLHAKTSESHPINISPIVPFELLPLISSHLIPTPPHTAYMFDLPPSLFLNHVAINASPTPSEAIRSYPMIRTPSEGLWTHSNRIGPHAPASISSGIWQKALLNRIPESTVMMNGSLSKGNEHVLNSNSSFYPLDSESVTQPHHVPIALSTSADLIAPDNGPLLFPISQDRPHSAPPSFMSSLTPLPETLTNGIACPPPLPDLVHAMSSDILDHDKNACRAENSGASSPSGDVCPPITWAHNMSSPFVPTLPALGNMLLSSCPGKKVRLSGPVKGRGAICRDLGHDLRRIKALGVGCVVCCLDDEELEFLGASWPQYSDIAQRVGLDVLRIPIPEGLGPVTPAQLDEHLSHIIHSFTLKGVPVLVHCRGGVGRAGLIACSWMLKLGLCGWLSSSVPETNGYVHQEHGNGMFKVRKETIQLVEKVIAVVRRRRSVKAIETYEQVRFLVEFVEHLRKGRRGFSL